MKVAILFDGIAASPDAAADERGVLESVAAVEKVLGDVGHACSRIPVADGLAWVDALRAADPEVVFNLCEGVEGVTALEPAVAALLELSGIPFTGATAECLALAHRKDAATALLAGAGLAVPLSTPVFLSAAASPAGNARSLLSVLGQTDPALDDWTQYPAIVKPAAEDASVGITQKSVARDASELAAAVHAARAHAPLLVQELLTGRELNVGIVGDTVLPVAEIVFTTPAEMWPIVDYRAKWDPGSDEDRMSSPECPARIPPEMARAARELASTAWSLLGGRGYGRVDLRANAAGELHILEVNPNPDLSPHAGLARMARVHGWNYSDLVMRIFDEALS